MLNQYFNIKLEELEKEKEEIQSAIVPYKKFTWFEKIFKRKQFKKYENESSKNDKQKNDLSHIEEMIDTLKGKHEFYKKTGIFQKIGQRKYRNL